MFIIRWVLHNYKEIVVVLLPVVSKRNKMLKYKLIIAYDKQHCTNVFIIRCEQNNDKVNVAVLLPVVIDCD